MHITPADSWQLNNHPNGWLRQVHGTARIYYRAIGSAESLLAKAEELGQAWRKGVPSDLVKKIIRERPPDQDSLARSENAGLIRHLSRLETGIHRQAAESKAEKSQFRRNSIPSRCLAEPENKMQ